MSRARAKKMLLSVLSINSQPPDLANDEITNPDNWLFQCNQFPKPYENSSIASNSDAIPLDANNYFLSNDETLHTGIISDEPQPYVIVAPANQPELENNPCLLNSQEPRLLNDLQGTEVSQINCILLSNDEKITANDNVQFEYIDQYVDEEFDASVIAPPNEQIITESPAINVIVPRSSSRNDPIVDGIEPNLLTSLNNVAKLVDYSDSSESELDEPRVKRKKRFQVKKSEWYVEKNRLNREKGHAYFGKRKLSDKWVKNIPKPKKEMKPRCKCSEFKSGVIKCHEITEEDRKFLFEQFWAMDWGEKKIFIKCLIKVMPTKRKRDRKDPNTSQRKNTMVYYLKKNDDLIRVCKTLFLNTFAINNVLCWSWKFEDTLRNSVKNLPQPEQPAQLQAATADKQFLDKFLDELPKLPSHYCRQRTSLLYLQPDIISKQQLYKFYKEECRSKNVKSLSIATFSNTLTLKKISLFKPKKDLCETCNGFKMGHVSEEIYNEHTQKKKKLGLKKITTKKIIDLFLLLTSKLF